MTKYLHTDPADDPPGGLTEDDLRAMILEAEKGPFLDGPTVMKNLRVYAAEYAANRKRSACRDM